jgi:hypothetical protein
MDCARSSGCKGGVDCHLDRVDGVCNAGPRNSPALMGVGLGFVGLGSAAFVTGVVALIASGARSFSNSFDDTNDDVEAIETMTAVGAGLSLGGAFTALGLGLPMTLVGAKRTKGRHDHASMAPRVDAGPSGARLSVPF